MQISVRSYLTAGTVAVVGAGAIAMTPLAPAVAPTAAVPLPTVAEVNLTAFSLNDVVGLLGNLGIGGALPGILTALPSLLPTDIVTAVVNEFLAQAGPLVTTAAGEVFGFLGTTLTGLITGPNSIPARFGDALAAIPTVVVTAIGSLTTGDIPAALQTLADGLAAPIAGITQAFAEAQLAFQEFVTAEFNGLVAVLPGVLFNAVQTVIGGSLQELIGSIGGALSDLIGGLFPGAGAAVPATLAVAAPAAAASVPDLGAPARSVSVAAPSADVPAAAAGQAAAAESAEVAADVVIAPAAEVEAAEVVSPTPRPRPALVRPVADAPAPAVTPGVGAAETDAEAATPSAPAAGKAGAANAGKGRAAQATRTAAE